METAKQAFALSFVIIQKAVVKGVPMTVHSCCMSLGESYLCTCLFMFLFRFPVGTVVASSLPSQLASLFCSPSWLSLSVSGWVGLFQSQLWLRTKIPFLKTLYSYLLENCHNENSNLQFHLPYMPWAGVTGTESSSGGRHRSQQGHWRHSPGEGQVTSHWCWEASHCLTSSPTPRGLIVFSFFLSGSYPNLFPVIFV